MPETLNSNKHNLPKTTNRRPRVILKDIYELDIDKIKQKETLKQKKF